MLRLVSHNAMASELPSSKPSADLHSQSTILDAEEPYLLSVCK